MTTWDDLFDPPNTRTEATTHLSAVSPIPANTSSYAAAALRGEAEAVASAANGTRNDTLNRAWFRMGRHVGAGSIDVAVVRTALAAAALQAGLPQAEIDTVLRDDATSALTNGAAVPRYPIEHPAPRDELPTPTVLDEGAPDHGAAVERMFPILNWQALWDAEDDEEWIVEPLLPARRLVALYSAPKVGKSLLMLELAVAISRGTAVLGVTVDRPRRVLYVDFENDPRGDIRTRLQSMDVGPSDLGNLCYLSFPTIAKLDTEMGALQLLAAVTHYECELVVIDTVSRAVGGEENANDTWLAFYRNTGLALKQAGVACVRLDHTGKDHDKGMRGGSAKYGDVDAVWKLSPISEDTYSLECTDNRMPVPAKLLTIARDSYPLAHRILGTHWQDALDAKASDVDATLDALGVPSSASVRECKKALRDADMKIRNDVIERAVKARKLRLDTQGEA